MYYTKHNPNLVPIQPKKAGSVAVICLNKKFSLYPNFYFYFITCAFTVYLNDRCGSYCCKLLLLFPAAQANTDYPAANSPLRKYTHNNIKHISTPIMKHIYKQKNI